jgi:hypothetical protein
LSLYCLSFFPFSVLSLYCLSFFPFSRRTDNTMTKQKRGRRTDNAMTKQKRGRRTDKDLQNTTQKTKDGATLTPLKTGGGTRVPLCCRLQGVYVYIIYVWRIIKKYPHNCSICGFYWKNISLT